MRETDMGMAVPSFSCSSPPLPSSSSRCCLLHRTGTTTITTNRLFAAAAAAASASSNVRCRRPSALPETASAVPVLVAGLVGVAATLLLQGKPADDQQQQEQPPEAAEECPACGGTGLCPRCKGEGFVFKELPEETASKARKAAKNMATRYTAGLPTKWTYCNRCSSTRSCTACGGSGTNTTT